MQQCPLDYFEESVELALHVVSMNQPAREGFGCCYSMMYWPSHRRARPGLFDDVSEDGE